MADHEQVYTSDSEPGPYGATPNSPTRFCVCGYEAETHSDLDEHIVAAAVRDEPDHSEAKRRQGVSRTER